MIASFHMKGKKDMIENNIKITDCRLCEHFVFCETAIYYAMSHTKCDEFKAKEVEEDDKCSE